jgi:hypothetical protein
MVRLTCPGRWTRGDLSVKARQLVTKGGIAVRLNGINVSGSSKLNDPLGVGRAFPLAEAETHARRLVACGFSVVRLLVPWEAVEPEQNAYDQDYLTYLDHLIGILKEHEIAVIIDPHQDVWSRFTGGSGAPYWTLLAAGFNPKHFRKTFSGLVMASLVGTSESECGTGPSDAEIADAAPLCWSTNHDMLACATMFTLFFGGRIFAPLRLVEGINIQDFLQKHFLDAIAAVLSKVGHHQNILGADTMNEPGAGFLGRPDLDKWQALGGGTRGHGIKLTPFQGMAIGNGAGGPGMKTTWHSGPVSVGQAIETVNPTHDRCWQENVRCVWEQHGVYTVAAQNAKFVLVKPAYFTCDPRTGRALNIQDQCVIPFWEAFATMTRNILGPTALVFRSPMVFASGRPPTPPTRSEGLIHREPWSEYDVHSPHYYEPLSLYGGPYLSCLTIRGQDPGPSSTPTPPIICVGNNTKAIRTELEWIAGSNPGPMFIGETGVSMRTRSLVSWLLHQAPDWTPGSRDYRARERCFERLMRAVESSDGVCGHALWCYTPNAGGPASYIGDGWNRECLSLFSGRMDQGSLFAGGQALGPAIRPYPVRTRAHILESCFNAIDPRRPYILRLTHGGNAYTCTEVFMPWYHYGTENVSIHVSSGHVVQHPHGQSLLWYHPPGTACLNMQRPVHKDRCTMQ